MQRNNEIPKNSSLKILPLLPKAFQHRSHYVELIYRQRAIRSSQETFVTAHFQPQLAFVARADRNLQVSLEFRRGCALCPASTILTAMDRAARRSCLANSNCSCAGNLRVAREISRASPYDSRKTFKSLYVLMGIAAPNDQALLSLIRLLLYCNLIHFKAAASVEPRSAGDSTVRMPAAAIAAYLSLAVPWPPLMIAPACPMRRPGGAVWPAMKPTTGFFTLALVHSAARSSALPPISPIIMMACVSGSLLKNWIASRNVVPIMGSPPMPMQVDWPMPSCVNWWTAS